MPTPRLPQVGSDENTWGEILNNFLEVSHNANGTIKNSPLLICKGFLSQTGTSDPVFTSIINTLDGVWARTAVGTYTLTKTGAFVQNKTIPEEDIYTDQNGNLFKINRTNENIMTLLTYASSDTTTLADSVLSGRFINIEIYS
jgi:hypothetical protein